VTTQQSTVPKKRKVRRLVIFEDKCGNWRIQILFNKGKCKTLGDTYDTHNTACRAASGIPLEHPRVMPLGSSTRVDLRI